MRPLGHASSYGLVVAGHPPAPAQVCHPFPALPDAIARARTVVPVRVAHTWTLAQSVRVMPSVQSVPTSTLRRVRLMRGSGLIWTIVGILLIIALLIWIF
ncbi:MAG: hypothetical protein DCC50_08660 [Acidobacteria bacterium]|nr:MAG: hypothetical protein DCC50_08660 [Acidobacteriota bacterium]